MKNERISLNMKQRFTIQVTLQKLLAATPKTLPAADDKVLAAIKRMTNIEISRKQLLGFIDAMDVPRDSVLLPSQMHTPVSVLHNRMNDLMAHVDSLQQRVISLELQVEDLLRDLTGKAED